jgi:hypothetical protein
MASRNSCSFGGLLSTLSAWSGVSPSATNRCPQPYKDPPVIDFPRAVTQGAVSILRVSTAPACV